MFYTHSGIIYADYFASSNKFILVVAPYLLSMFTIFFFVFFIVVLPTNISEEYWTWKNVFPFSKPLKNNVSRGLNYKEYHQLYLLMNFINIEWDGCIAWCLDTITRCPIYQSWPSPRLMRVYKVHAFQSSMCNTAWNLDDSSAPLFSLIRQIPTEGIHLYLYVVPKPAWCFIF